MSQRAPGASTDPMGHEADGAGTDPAGPEANDALPEVRTTQDGPPAGDGEQAAPRRRLDLGDPLDRTAGEDRPESWGEGTDSDAARLAYYRAQRPPHHGG